MALNIAMDGPVGAGKSSVARAVAHELGILHLDTGAMYRAVGLAALRNGVSLQDEQAVTELCGTLRIQAALGEGGQRTLLDGEDVSGLIRTEEVGMAASAVSSYAGVRKAMVSLQRQLAESTDLLADGRDIGTNVLPNAPLKIYLTASAEERANRRFLELQQKGAPDTYEQVLADLKQRDEQDMNRAVNPLRPAEDAVIVDTTHMSFDEVVAEIVRLAKETRV